MNKGILLANLFTYMSFSKIDKLKNIYNPLVLVKKRDICVYKKVK